jgi:putative ABC transport system permease protein
MKLFLLIIKNLRRNLLRTILTSMGTFVMVLVLTLIWSILWFLQAATTDRNKDFKSIITERWKIPSQMPFAYAKDLSLGGARNEGDILPTDSMTWQFYGGTLDPAKRTRENFLFAIAMEPKKMATMMDELDSLPDEQAAQLQRDIKGMEAKKSGLMLGRLHLEKLNKRIGDRLKIFGLNYKDIDLEFEIVGTFPPGRNDLTAIMNCDYLNDALDNYQRTHNGKAHAMAQKTLNLVWLRVPDSDAFSKVSDQIVTSPSFASPAVKVETASSAISNFMESYSTIIFAMRWILAPAILITLSMIIANAISISVRERFMEMAVLKVLGFRPGQIMLLVLGEALLLGTVVGLASSVTTYLFVNDVVGGIPFPIAFFPRFLIPPNSLWWGPVVGSFTALAGSLLPAWSARTVKVSEVFSKVA